MVKDIKKWEHVIFNDQKTFIENFIEDAKNVVSLTSVYWNSCSMLILYVTKNKEKHADNFTLSLWEKYYYEKKKHEDTQLYYIGHWKRWKKKCD